MKYIRIIKFSQILKICELSKNIRFSKNYLKIKDYKGSIADCHSLLGMMTLNYNNPVELISDNENYIDYIIHNIKLI